jgi:hypothetical protein
VDVDLHLLAGVEVHDHVVRGVEAAHHPVDLVADLEDLAPDGA